MVQRTLSKFSPVGNGLKSPSAKSNDSLNAVEIEDNVIEEKLFDLATMHDCRSMRERAKQLHVLFVSHRSSNQRLEQGFLAYIFFEQH